MNIQLHRYVIIADHPDFEGVTSFCFIASDPARAKRLAWGAAFTYFRDDPTNMRGPVEVPLGACDQEIDHVVDRLANNVDAPAFTREEAFGRE